VARGHLELVGRLDDPDADRSVRLALEELDRIRSVVEELLLLARLDEGLPLAREAVEVDLLLGEVAVRGMVLGRGEVAVDTDEGLAVIGDPDRLLQVLSNLVGNAVRYGGDGVTVTLSARGERAAGTVALEVADTGPGIPADDLERIFDRFYRGTAARQGVPGGAGLGLAIVVSLVEAMGGEISARSTVGRGTTFCIRMPAAPNATPPAPGGAGGEFREVGEAPGKGTDQTVSGRRGG
jgi:signal transduction histidine kinase